MKTLRPSALMIRYQAVGLLTLIIALFSGQSLAVDLLCSKPDSVASGYELASASNASEQEDEFELANGFSVADLTLNDLFEVFKSGRVSRSNDRVLLCVFPENNGATRELFSELGIGSKAAGSLYKADAQSERKVKTVASDAEMSACVASAYPSIGYVANATIKQQKQLCF